MEIQHSVENLGRLERSASGQPSDASAETTHTGDNAAGSRADKPDVASRQSILLQCLDAASSAAGGDDRWVSARAVARRLSPTADPEAIGRDLNRLHRLGLVEQWFKGGHTYYRPS
jgi:hypothetical protein